MTALRILADDLTGALDCAAAFGAGVPVHLGKPGPLAVTDMDVVATATRDVALAQLPALLMPSLAWLREADLAFKKVDSLLRGNTLDEVDWLARHAPFAGLAVVPAFPSQQRVTEDAQQWWRQPDGTRKPVGESIREGLQRRGWRVDGGPNLPDCTTGPVAWVPDVLDDARLDALARVALQAESRWLWCGSAGLAHALARQLLTQVPAPIAPQGTGPVMLVSASHHPVSRAQWHALRAVHGDRCHVGEDPNTLHVEAHPYPALIDLAANKHLTSHEAAALLHAQARTIAARAPRPGTLVVVGGDTLLALCHALGATALQSEVALDRSGWGCARMRGGRWDGLLCHTRSGAFGGPQDLQDVLALLGFPQP